jgi:hypothetical protein
MSNIWNVVGELPRNHLPKLSEKSRRHPKRGPTRHPNRPVRPVLDPIEGPDTRQERHSHPFSDSFSTLDFSHLRVKGVGYALVHPLDEKQVLRPPCTDPRSSQRSEMGSSNTSLA